VSLSARAAVAGGLVIFWPVGFNLDSYTAVINDKAYLKSFVNSILRVSIGTTINMFIVLITAFPLIKNFRGRTVIIWYMVFTMLFNGGLIPTYLTIKELHLLNSFWVLVLPGAVNVFSVILMMNFFKRIPKEMDEAASMDGASNFRTLWSIYLPMSLPAIATLTLFAAVIHWNQFFDAIVFLNDVQKYPLQAYLQTKQINELSIILEGNVQDLAELSNRSLRAAQIFVGTLPILMIYPYLQKHFVKGIVIGSVKE
jgi:putative aldouronate transport system permease protein